MQKVKKKKRGKFYQIVFLHNKGHGADGNVFSVDGELMEAWNNWFAHRRREGEDMCWTLFV